jgi:hypothetical protein
VMLHDGHEYGIVAFGDSDDLASCIDLFDGRRPGLSQCRL